jgi:hypothetical protein
MAGRQSIKKQFEFLDQIHSGLDAAAGAYKEYLDAGKTFVHAKNIRLHNVNLKTLILEKGSILTNELHKDALLIVAHFDAWMQKWDEHQKNTLPNNEDEFAFPNEHVFPKQAARNLDAEYTRLKQLIDGE